MRASAQAVGSAFGGVSLHLCGSGDHILDLRVRSESENKYHDASASHARNQRDQGNRRGRNGGSCSDENGAACGQSHAALRRQIHINHHITHLVSYST